MATTGPEGLIVGAFLLIASVAAIAWVWNKISPDEGWRQL
jgi:hypothetical protein